MLKHNQPLPAEWIIERGLETYKLKIGDIVTPKPERGDHNGTALPSGFLYKVIDFIGDSWRTFIVTGFRKEDIEQIWEHTSEHKKIWECPAIYYDKVKFIGEKDSCLWCLASCKRDKPCEFYEKIS